MIQEDTENTLFPNWYGFLYKPGTGRGPSIGDWGTLQDGSSDRNKWTPTPDVVY